MKIEICLEIKKETDEAYLMTDGVTEAWLPASLIVLDYEGASGDAFIVTMPEYLAKEKGFI